MIYSDNTYNFEDYFETVVDNVSDGVLSDELWNQHFHAIQEIIHEMFFIQVPKHQAVRIIECVFLQLGSRLKEGFDHKEAENYISGK